MTESEKSENSFISRKRWTLCDGFGILTGGVLLLWALASVQTEAQERLKISYSSVDAPNANWYIAEDRKLYQKYGLEADLVFIPTSTTNVALSWRVS
jgi:ABC-type nitrate/sulfonate/bicarbonate transport system substrate-binding protein